jgi:hypothetical protein
MALVHFIEIDHMRRPTLNALLELEMQISMDYGCEMTILPL